MDLKETKEVYAFLINFLSDLKDAKKGDGEISTIEWTKATFANAPAGVKALIGIDKVDDEIKDADEAELQELAMMGVELAKALTALALDA